VVEEVISIFEEVVEGGRGREDWLSTREGDREGGLGAKQKERE